MWPFQYCQSVQRISDYRPTHYQQLRLSATPIISNHDYRPTDYRLRVLDSRQTSASVFKLNNIICMLKHTAYVSDYRHVQFSARPIIGGYSRTTVPLHNLHNQGTLLN